jgi:hypothetical protein
MARFYDIETSAKPAIRRSGVSAERRKPLEIEECGFLPKAATLLFTGLSYQNNLFAFSVGVNVSVK